MLNSKLTKKMIISAALVASCGLAGIASAALSEIPNKAVAYSDLDLSQQAGQQALYARLKKASQAVCGQGGNFRTRDLASTMRVRHCQKASLNNAVEQLSNEKVLQLHQSS